MNYEHYTAFSVAVHENGIAEMSLGCADKMPTLDHRGHGELAEVWRDFDRDPLIKVIIVRGQSKGFSAGGTLDLVQDMADHFEHRARVWKEGRELVYNMINCSKIIISAINGPAVGGGLAVALMADISIAAKNARLIDGHTRLGVAERIGLVSLAVDQDELMAKAFEIAGQLAAGPQSALRWTKHSLNNWLRQAGPLFDNAMALEILGFTSPDLQAGLAAVRNRTPPVFPGDCPI